ncbi:MAG: hypothetical protein JNG84_05215 [Archangium sp.]|nr:hypothetical protein [Archangium sp.]
MATDELMGWRRWVMGPRSLWLALAVGAGLSLPSLLGGLFIDDYFQHLVLEGDATMPPRGTFDLFTFATEPAEVAPMIAQGSYAWWTWPELHLSFFRPLSSALARFDHLAFGRALAWHHVHSVLWFLALVAVASALFRRALTTPAVAGLAAVLFALDDVHMIPMAWLANRNALVATTPVLLGLLAHLRWREHGWRPGLPLSLLGYAAGLCGGESAVGALAYLAAYELTAGPGAWSHRVRALIPVGVLGLGYLALTRSMGVACVGSGVYLDPRQQPLEFLANAPGRMLAIVSTQVLAFPADAWLLLQSLRPMLVFGGVASLALVAWLLRVVWPSLSQGDRRGITWLGTGALLSLIPVAAAFPLTRLALMPSLGSAAVVAVILRSSAARVGRARWGAAVLALTNVVFPVVGWAAQYGVGGFAQRTQLNQSLETRMTEAQLARRTMTFVAPDVMASTYTPLVRRYFGRSAPEVWLTVSMARTEHRLTRTDERTFELEVVGGRMLDTVFEQLVRAPNIPLPLGTTVQLAGAQVTVTGLDEGLPNRLRIHLDDAVETWTFAKWDDGVLAPLVLPAVGESIVLPRLPSVLTL